MVVLALICDPNCDSSGGVTTPVLLSYGEQSPCLEYSESAVCYEKVCGSAAPRIRPAGLL